MRKFMFLNVSLIRKLQWKKMFCSIIKKLNGFEFSSKNYVLTLTSWKLVLQEFAISTCNEDRRYSFSAPMGRGYNGNLRKITKGK